MDITDIAAQVKERITLAPGLPNPNPTQSSWQQPPHPTVANIQSDLAEEADIVIIGSGVTGCGAAHALLHHPDATKLRITLLEARGTCSGATGRNGGHICSNILESFAHNMDTHGLEAALETARFSEANAIRLREVAASLAENDREATELRDVVLGLSTSKAETMEGLKAAVRLLEKEYPDSIIKFRFVEDQDRIKEFSFQDDIVGLVEQHGAAAVWPYRLITAIFQKLLKEFDGRFTLQTDTPVQTIRFNQSESLPYSIITPRGIIRAHKVLHCTNGFAGHLVPNLVGAIYPLRGTMSVQEPGSDFPLLGDHFSWSSINEFTYRPESDAWDTQYHYVQQNAKTGEIWIGGECQKLSELLTSDDSTVGETTQQKLSTVLPSIFSNVEPHQVRQVWSGIMAFTSDGCPIVGRIPSSISGREGQGEWIAAGYNGHGMDKAWLCGEGIARMALGEGSVPGLPQIYLLGEERLNRLTADESVGAFKSMFS
ncbi:FAD dependent oxidoreductase superfamily protein [Penicillium cosmopolitanum]|uniref:FAD dependent oxidoreductase superfamily protein n=1 Tax=Penicillium cosmopolitanum TaxID=1131564 RepID=A0A9X0B4Z6_9EURO|nr:FAD dependent oxidoreductase superfamily protein [Penicillium cosmopolitanum]KAJ5388338.1 FAD dependent oxidoreductase superfamily protein [Penicillium cosmopolitanum]